MTAHRPTADADTPRSRYRAAVTAMAVPLHQRFAARDTADHALLTGRREIRERVAASAVEVTRADDAVVAAQAAVRTADEEAARLWRELGEFHGRRGVVGELPAAAVPDTAHPGSAPALLARAQRTLAQARRGELRIAPPVPIWLAMVLAGVLGAALFGVVGRVLLIAARGMPVSERAALDILAEIAFLATPVAGIALGLTWLSRYGQPMTARAFGVLLTTGVVVGCGLFAVLAH